MSSSISVLVEEELLQAVFETARRLYPREIVLLLRGEKRRIWSRFPRLLFHH